MKTTISCLALIIGLSGTAHAQTLMHFDKNGEPCTQHQGQTVCGIDNLKKVIADEAAQAHTEKCKKSPWMYDCPQDNSAIQALGAVLKGGTLPANAPQILKDVAAHTAQQEADRKAQAEQEKAQEEAMEAQRKERQAKWDAEAPKRAEAEAKANSSSEDCADTEVTNLKSKGVTVNVQDYADFKQQCYNHIYLRAMAE
jgi:hypothetical protein